MDSFAELTVDCFVVNSAYFSYYKEIVTTLHLLSHCHHISVDNTLIKL